LEAFKWGQVEASYLNRAGWDGGSAGPDFAPSLLTVAEYFNFQP